MILGLGSTGASGQAGSIGGSGMKGKTGKSHVLPDICVVDWLIKSILSNQCAADVYATVVWVFIFSNAVRTRGAEIK